MLPISPPSFIMYTIFPQFPFPRSTSRDRQVPFQSLLVRLNHLLHLVITPQEDPTPIVDVFRLNL